MWFIWLWLSFLFMLLCWKSKEIKAFVGDPCQLWQDLTSPFTLFLSWSDQILITAVMVGRSYLAVDVQSKVPPFPSQAPVAQLGLLSLVHVPGRALFQLKTHRNQLPAAAAGAAGCTLRPPAHSTAMRDSNTNQCLSEQLVLQRQTFILSCAAEQLSLGGETLTCTRCSSAWRAVFAQLKWVRSAADQSALLENSGSQWDAERLRVQIYFLPIIIYYFSRNTSTPPALDDHQIQILH